MSIADSNRRRNKGGCVWKDKDGYLIKDWVTPEGTKHRKRLNRYVMEEYLGRRLLPSELVHHKNHNKEDNRIENLEIVNGHHLHKVLYHHNAWNKGTAKWYAYKCALCGKSSKSRLYAHKFCSRKCVYKAQIGRKMSLENKLKARNRQLGSNNSNWKGEK
jgi:hypothetical protein